MHKKYLVRGKNFSIDDFIIDGQLTYYKDRIFFIQHLMPYCLFVEKFKGEKVLEIGIGDGFGSFYLKKNGLEVTALDIDYQAGQLLRERYINRFNIKIDFVNGDATNLPFKDNSFDGVITCQVIEHIPENFIIDFLKEI
ncbi:MAG: class I SAM-dependent methyltransferase [Candidatus Omnitrophota bacterium]